MATRPSWQLEAALWQAGFSPVAGIDEAGRGALAGPVVAAAVILPYGAYAYRDSKTLTPKQRAALGAEVRERALAWAVASSSAREVDRLNVLRATHLAAARALAALEREGVEGVLARGGRSLRPRALVTDYLKLAFAGPVSAPPKADSLSYGVAAASLLAKTARDALMQELAARYPGYGFADNKGYGSASHHQGLLELGPSPEHRLTYKPVAQRRLFDSGR